jgi:hypothetical protein
MLMTRGTWIVALALLLVVSAAPADDLYPPEWRGQNRSIFQEWTFPNGDTDQLPCEYEENCCPEIELPVATLVGGDLFWMDSFEGKVGVIGNDGNASQDILFQLPNCPDEEPIKFLRIQMLYFPDTPSGGCPDVGVEAWKDDVAIPEDDILLTDTQIFDAGEGWKLGLRDFEILPNPDLEDVTLALPVGYGLDQVVIDTISIPEPVTLAVLATGGIALLARRRRS